MGSTGTLREAILHFADFEHCKEFMTQLRWPNGVVKCPTCGAEKVTWLAKRRVWKCYSGHVRPTFSLKTGTIFEDSPIALEKWLPATWMLLNAKNGISSWELHRALGVTQKTAWFMLHRIRVAMEGKTFNKLMGEVDADETFIGGKAKFMHNADRIRKMQGKRGGPSSGNKTIVMGVLESAVGRCGLKCCRTASGTPLNRCFARTWNWDRICIPMRSSPMHSSMTNSPMK